MTWTAAAIGGTGPYTFKFFVNNGSSWSLGQDWSTSNTWVWRPTVPGTYNFQVWARNAGSSATFDAWRPAGPVSISAPPALSLTGMSPNLSSPVAAGSHVTWTATATGGTGPYTYKFFVYDGSTWTMGQDWSSSNTWTWTPPGPGTYNFQVWARNAASGAMFDAWRPAGPLVVTGPPALTITSLFANQAFPIPAGTPVTWTAFASGGSGPYSYKFWIYDGVTWTLGSDWSTANTFEWTPSFAGNYSVQVWLRSIGSAATYDGWGGFGPYGVTSPSALAVTSLTADRTLAGARRHAGHMDRPCEGRNRALHVPILGEQRFDLDARSGLERFFVLALDSTRGRLVPIPGLGAERRLGEHVRRMAARRSGDGRRSSAARSHECHAGARLSPDRRHARKCESDGRRRDGPVHVQAVGLRRIDLDAGPGLDQLADAHVDPDVVWHVLVPGLGEEQRLRKPVGCLGAGRPLYDCCGPVTGFR